MHWVDRGSEPDGLQAIRAKYSGRWVEHYRHGLGEVPSDSRWREFSDELRDRFNGLCAYCETRAKGEVEHFRPKSRYPELVYAWPNWLFSCHDCNHAKSSKWPGWGYVDPCAKTIPARPEQYFGFDTSTGEILPINGLSERRRAKAQKTIDDLRLNEWHHLKNRTERLMLAAKLLEASVMTTHDLASRSLPWSSITRAWLSKHGYDVDD